MGDLRTARDAARRRDDPGSPGTLPGMKPYARLTQPLVRDEKTDPLRPTTWDEALGKVVDGFATVKERSGPTALGIFSCSKATNEVNYAAQKYARTVLGSNNLDSCNRT